MEIVGRDWKLFSEVAALNIHEGELDFNRRLQLKLLLQTAEMLVPTMHAAIAQKLEPLKPAVFSSQRRQTPSFGSTSADLQYLRNQSPETKTENDWNRQCWLEIEDHCWNVTGTQGLWELEKCQHKKEKCAGWDIRSHLNLEFMEFEQDMTVDEIFRKSESDMIDRGLNAALEADDDLKVLDEWVTPKHLYIPSMTEEDMQPLVGWRAGRSWQTTCSSGEYKYVLNRKAKYLFTFHRYACSLEQAYRIIDHLHSYDIPAVVVLLDPEVLA
jgi:hypothetical protein